MPEKEVNNPVNPVTKFSPRPNVQRGYRQGGDSNIIKPLLTLKKVRFTKKWLPSSFRSQIKDIWDFSFHTIEDAAAEFNISEQMVKRNIEQQLYSDALEEIKELKEKINASTPTCITTPTLQSPAPTNPSPSQCPPRKDPSV